MDEKQYLRMRAKAEEEYKKNLEAIDRVWHMAHPDKSAPGATRMSSSPSGSLNGSNQSPFVLTNTVDQIVAQMAIGSDVSQPIVLAKLLEIRPELRPRVKKDQIKPRIAGRLSKMEKLGALLKVRESHGSDPAVFQKIRPIHTIRSTHPDIDHSDALPLT